MAGGLGFEPRLTESESAVLPLDDPPNKALTFRVLRGPPRFAQTNFLTLNFTRVASDIARFAQSTAQAFVVLHQRACNAVANRAGLTEAAAASHSDLQIQFLIQTSQH